MLGNIWKSTGPLQDPGCCSLSLLVTEVSQTEPGSQKEEHKETGLEHQLHPLVQATQPIEVQHLQ